jgi:branched-chain amino acid transport system substrate-binding protein
MPLDDSLASTPSPEKGRQNVQRMIEDGRVLGMIGPYTSNVAFDEIPLANSAGLVMLSPANTNPCLTQVTASCSHQPAALRPRGPNNYFRIVAPDPAEGRAMARFAARSLNVTRVAAFTEYPTDEDPVVDSFAVELAQAGGKLVLRQNLGPGTTDFTGFLTAARAEGAQAIYAATIGDHACNARAQMKTIFPHGYFLGFDGIVVSDCISDAADNSEGMLGTVTDVDLATSSEPALKRFRDAYQKEFGGTSNLAPYTFAAYECTRILIDAIARAMAANGGAIPTRAQVVNAVAYARLTGATGTYSFDARGDVISPFMAIYEVHAGKWVYLRQIDASSTES